MCCVHVAEVELFWWESTASMCLVELRQCLTVYLSTYRLYEHCRARQQQRCCNAFCLYAFCLDLTCGRAQVDECRM